MVSSSFQALCITLLSTAVLADPVLTARDPGVTVEASGAYVGTAFVPKGSTSVVTDGTLVWSVGADGTVHAVGTVGATAAASASVSDTTSSDASGATGVATTSNGVAVSVGSGGVSIGPVSSTTSSDGDSASTTSVQTESTNVAAPAAMVGSFGALGGGIAVMAALL